MRRFAVPPLLALLAACSETVYPVPVEDAPARGPGDAWVTVVEFSDFECPYCGRVQGALTILEKTYGADLRVVFRHFPLGFHARALPAAVASECARLQDRFWPMHDAIFAAQDRLSDADLRGYASDAGADVVSFDACLAQPAPAARVEADRALGSSMDVEGTPTFFVNGRMRVGALSVEELSAVVDEELDRARSSGIPRAEYYARAVLGR